MLSTGLVYSDASKFACGAHIMLNKAIAHRMWVEHEVSKSSTWHEIKAIHFSLLSFLPFLRFWHTDNKNTVSAVLKGSNKDDIHSVALDIFSCCLQNGITLCPVWIPRSENELADKISKICDYDDWFVRNLSSSKLIGYGGLTPLTALRIHVKDNSYVKDILFIQFLNVGNYKGSLLGSSKFKSSIFAAHLVVK